MRHTRNTRPIYRGGEITGEIEKQHPSLSFFEPHERAKKRAKRTATTTTDNFPHAGFPCPTGRSMTNNQPQMPLRFRRCVPSALMSGHARKLASKNRAGLRASCNAPKKIWRGDFHRFSSRFFLAGRGGPAFATKGSFAIRRLFAQGWPRSRGHIKQDVGAVCSRNIPKIMGEVRSFYNFFAPRFRVQMQWPRGFIGFFGPSPRTWRSVGIFGERFAERHR